MDSLHYLCFNYNPFEDIEQNRETIWRLDMFEESIPPLMTESSVETDPQSEPQTRHNDQDVTSLANPSDSYAAGDGRELWSVDSRTVPKSGPEGKHNKLQESRYNLTRFPEKLWTIIEECDSGAIKWSDDGLSIVIKYDIFRKQYLSDFSHFKTRNMASFVRQLNLYGFHKVNLKARRRMLGLSSPTTDDRLQMMSDPLLTASDCSHILESFVFDDDCHEFKCDFFRRDQKDLMCRMQRKYSCFPNERNCQNAKHSHQKKQRDRKRLAPKNCNIENKTIAKKAITRRKASGQTFGQTFGRRFGQTVNRMIESESKDSKYSKIMIFGDSIDCLNDNNEKSEFLSMNDTSTLFTSFL